MKNVVRVTSEIGRKFYINKSDTHLVDRLEKKPYQMRNLRFVRKCCPVKPVIVDVGMHIGENTIEYATWASEVHGFEPCKESFDFAQKNVNYNKKYYSKKKYWFYLNSRASLEMTGNVFLYNVGLGSTEEVKGFKFDNNTGHSRFSDTGTENVQVKTLDSYNFKSVDIIKIDVEGYELFVLQGARETIKRCHPVIQLEIIESNLNAFGIKPEQLFNFFKSLDDYLFVSYKGALVEGYYKGGIGVSDYFFIPGDLYDVLDKKVLAEQDLLNREKFKCGLLRNSRFYEWYDDVVMKEDKIKLRE